LKSISANEVKEKLLNNEQLHIIDVREAEEVQQGKIPNAVNIPLSLLEFRMHELDRNIPYIVVCRSGNRSGLAVQLLTSYGFDATNMVGGMHAWDGPVD
jgi:rhodanese-related sulfurtransferase